MALVMLRYVSATQPQPLARMWQAETATVEVENLKLKIESTKEECKQQRVWERGCSISMQIVSGS